MKLLLTLIIFGSLPAFAGNGSHGGEVIYCPNKKPVILDYFNAALKPFGEKESPAIDVEGMKTQDVVDLIQSRLEGSKVGEEFTKSLNLLGPIEKWAEADLGPVSDSETAYLVPPGCYKKTVALRQRAEPAPVLGRHKP
jgi:hypothetical protein